MPKRKPGVFAALALIGAAAATLAAGWWPARASTDPSLIPYSAHLCDPAARATSTHCEFSLGAERRLRVPWGVFGDEPEQCGDLRDCGGWMVPHPDWPLRGCAPRFDCIGTVGRSDRAGALTYPHRIRWEEWRLDGAILADGRGVHGRGQFAPETTRLHLRIGTRHDLFSGPRQYLEHLFGPRWRERTVIYEEAGRTGRATVKLIPDGTGGMAIGSGPNERTFEVMYRAEDRVLVRECSGLVPRLALCAIEGRNGDLSFHIRWSGSALGTDEVMAAAASLFDGYVVSGPGLAP